MASPIQPQAAAPQTSKPAPSKPLPAAGCFAALPVAFAVLSDGTRVQVSPTPEQIAKREAEIRALDERMMKQYQEILRLQNR